MDLINIKQFVSEHADTITLAAMSQRIRASNVEPVEMRPRCHGGGLYRREDLDGLLAKKRRVTAPKKPIPADAGRQWVPFPVGTRLEVTNAAGRKLVGIFEGYKGDVLANLQLEKEITVFARDAKLRAVGDDVPLSIDDPVEVPRSYFNTVFEQEEIGPKPEKKPRPTAPKKKAGARTCDDDRLCQIRNRRQNIMRELAIIMQEV